MLKNQENAVILYTIDCPKCKVLKNKLDKKNVEYKIVEDVDIMLEKGFNSAPMLEVLDKAYTFNEAIRWLNGQ